MTMPLAWLSLTLPKFVPIRPPDIIRAADCAACLAVTYDLVFCSPTRPPTMSMSIFAGIDVRRRRRAACVRAGDRAGVLARETARIAEARLRHHDVGAVGCQRAGIKPTRPPVH